MNRRDIILGAIAAPFAFLHKNKEPEGIRFGDIDEDEDLLVYADDGTVGLHGHELRVTSEGRGGYCDGFWYEHPDNELRLEQDD